MPLAEDLRSLLAQELPHLRAISDAASTVPRGAGKWSPREELGHLIDSAANNHQRFVRAALSGEYSGPPYAQEAWVRIHDYREQPWDEVVEFWHQYNGMIARVVSAIPDNLLQSPCTVGSDPTITLARLIEDYIIHMQHHLDLLLRRPTVTPFPRVE